MRAFTLDSATSAALDAIVDAGLGYPGLGVLFPPSIDSAREDPAPDRDDKGLSKADYAALYTFAGLPAKTPGPRRIGSHALPPEPAWRLLTRALERLDMDAANAALAEARRLSSNNLGGPRLGRPPKDAHPPPSRGPMPPNASRVADALINMGLAELRKRIELEGTKDGAGRNDGEGPGERAGREGGEKAAAGAVRGGPRARGVARLGGVQDPVLRRGRRLRP